MDKLTRLGLQNALKPSDNDKHTKDRYKTLLTMLSIAHVIEPNDTLEPFWNAILQPPENNIFYKVQSYTWDSPNTFVQNISKVRNLLLTDKAKEICSHDDKLNTVCIALAKLQVYFKSEAAKLIEAHKGAPIEVKKRTRKPRSNQAEDAESINSDTAVANIATDVKKAQEHFALAIKTLLIAKDIIQLTTPSLTPQIQETIQALQTLNFSDDWKQLLDA